MQSLCITGYGGLDKLELRDVPRPEPGPSQVLVRVKASSLNPLDWKLRSGMLRFVWPIRLPFTPGFDVAGIVESVGADVTRFQPGDAVFAALKSGGGQAEFAAVDETVCVRKPDHLEFEKAAGMPIAAISALQALRDLAKVADGSHVLVNGASGGVGTFAVQIARVLGCKVTGVASTPNLELVRSLGADAVIDYTQQDVFEAQPYDCFFDVVPNRSFRECLNALAPGGSYVTTIPRPGPVLWNVLARIGRPFGCSRRCEWLLAKPNRRDLEYISQLIAEGTVEPIVEHTYTLQEFRRAYEQLETGHTRGKIVVRMP